MSDYVDPEELPFTRDELYRAFATFLNESLARTVADSLADTAPDIVQWRAERRTRWRKGGVSNADSIVMHSWVYPSELLPALAALSLDATARAEQLTQRIGRALSLEQPDRSPSSGNCARPRPTNAARGHDTLPTPARVCGRARAPRQRSHEDETRQQ
jgi:hypothetical protein